MEAVGIELPQQNTGDTSFSCQSGAECGTLDADLAQLTDDLTLVVEAWPRLTDAMCEKIVAMIRSAD